MSATRRINDLEKAIVRILLDETIDLPLEVDASRLIDFAQHNGVLVLIAPRLLASDTIEADLRILIEEYQKEAIAADAVWEQETVRVLQAIDEAGVEAILLKGMALAHSLYEQPHLRPRVDADILIEKKSLEAVRNLLRSLGYHERSSWGGDLHHSQAAFQKQLLPGVRFTWDVHWLLTNRFAWGSRFDWPEIVESAVPLPSLGSSARALSRPWALLHACIHLVGHHRGEEKLIWLWDIKLLLERLETRDLHIFEAMVRRFGMEEVVGQAFAEVGARGLVKPRFLPPFSVLHLPEENRRITRMWRELQSLPGWRLKAGWVVQLLFPSRSDLGKVYGRPIPAALVPLFIVHRWFRGAARVARRRSRNGDRD